jgi:5'(3')-deoxyribonucleotidase
MMSLMNEIVRPSKLKVWLDMDGVLADFFGEWAKLDGKDHYKDIGNTEAALQMVREHPTFWIDLDVLPGAKELIATVIKHYGEYRICSKQLEGDPRCRAGKIAWIKTHLADMPPKEIHIVDEKTPFAVDANGNPNILVDDYGKNIVAWKAAGGIAIKYDSNNYNDALKLLVSLSKV